VFRDLGAQSFRNINSAVRLGDIFRPIREAKLDLSQTVLVDPVLGKKPFIDGNGLLLMEGFFPIEPLAPVYKMTFRYEAGQWRLFSISVGADKLETLRDKARNSSPSDPGKDEKKKN
jgi:hypothetical protein